MWHFVLRRFLKSIPVIIGIVSLVFFLLHFAPGDPVDLMLGEAGADVDRSYLREKLGLHLSLTEQYFKFWKNIFVASWGESFLYERPVLSLILAAFPKTLLLSLSSLFVALCFSIPFGVFAAYKKSSLWDKGLTSLSLLGMSLPIFVTAPIAVLAFSIYLRLLPVAGSETFSHLILPSFCLGFGLTALLTRMVRNSMLEHLQEDFVRTARAKGMSELRVLFLHTFKNSLVPLVTLIGNILGSLFAGAVITESLFDWPGIGQLFLKAFASRDFPLVQGIVLWIALSYVFVSLAIDLSLAYVDPRIRFDEESHS